jgi:hypothetical protein
MGGTVLGPGELLSGHHVLLCWLCQELPFVCVLTKKLMITLHVTGRGWLLSLCLAAALGVVSARGMAPDALRLGAASQVVVS